MSKTFHISDLISVTTGRLVSLRQMDGLYDLVNYVTGQLHSTHQLGRAAEEVVKPEMLRQFPWLAEIAVPDNVRGKGPVMEWLVEVGSTERGQWFEVEPLPEGAYVGREAVAELREMAPDTPIVSVGEAPDDLDGGPKG